MLTGVSRNRRGTVINALVIFYTLAGYAGGVALLCAANAYANAAGVLLVAQALVYSAYLVHEFAHGTVFKSPETNAFFANLMNWLNGSCYARFADLREKHLRHHVERADVITLDYKNFLKRHRLLRRIVLALEWLYIPAVEFIMRLYVIVLPFVDKERAGGRRRIIGILAVRCAIIAAAVLYRPKALLLYLAAYWLFITALRFIDAFQHTYRAYEARSAPPAERPDRAYEQANTYSNLLAVRHTFLNLLVLNFTYHNAHHERPLAPWYNLPKIHKELYGDGCGQIIPARRLLRNFHEHRLRRVLNGDCGTVNAAQGDAYAFIGAVGVSFLTAV